MSIHQPSHRYFTIQGNIGCGKSTVLKVLIQYFPDIQFLQEPVQKWRNVNNTGVNILQKYYQNPSRWGLTFLSYALFTRLKSLQHTKDLYSNSIIISERSPLSDNYVFFPLMKDLRTLNQTEILLFEETYKGLENIIKFQKPRIIYLRSSPEICKQRAEKRRRSEESSIPLEYFNKLHQKHQEWMQQEQKENLLIIDTSIDFENDQKRIKEIVNMISQFLQKKH